MSVPTPETIQLHIEALIFATDQPIGLDEIVECIQQGLAPDFDADAATAHLQAIRAKYQQPQHFMALQYIAEGYQFLTKPAYNDTLNLHLKQKSNKRLSRAALETLSIIAYKQPVSKAEMEQIRGVNCDYAVQKLLEKELIAITGRSDAPGRPLLYGTSPKFMDYFGLESLQDLPKLKEFKPADQEIGTPQSIEEEQA